MIRRGPVFAAGALAVGTLAWWLAPFLLALVGLGDLAIVGQVCVVVVVLSGLEAVFRRIGPPEDR